MDVMAGDFIKRREWEREHTKYTSYTLFGMGRGKGRNGKSSRVVPSRKDASVHYVTHLSSLTQPDNISVMSPKSIRPCHHVKSYLSQHIIELVKECKVCTYGYILTAVPLSLVTWTTVISCINDTLYHPSHFPMPLETLRSVVFARLFGRL